MSTNNPRYEPAAFGVPTAVSNSNISLLQSGYSLQYNDYVNAIMGFKVGDNKHDLTTSPYGDKKR